MVDITIYTTPICPYCVAAKQLLKRKGAEYSEIDVARNSALRAEMTERSGGRRTVPQIFVGERHIGGFDDMNELDRNGDLDPILVENPV